MGRGDPLTQVEFPARGKWNIVTDGSTICAQQTAKIWRKAPKGIFDTLKRHPNGCRFLWEGDCTFADQSTVEPGLGQGNLCI